MGTSPIGFSSANRTLRRRPSRRPAAVLLLAAALHLGWLIPVSSAQPAIKLVQAVYRADVPFPQFMHLWSENWALKSRDGEPLAFARPGMPLGAYIQLYVQNNSADNLDITGVNLEGINLDNALPFGDRKAAGLFPASLHFSRLPATDLERLIAAGEPVWWKADPGRLDPGAFAEVTIRLRRDVNNQHPRRIEVLTSKAKLEAHVPCAPTPRFASLSFSPNLDIIYAYVQSPEPPARAPARILLDDQDLTSRTASPVDTNIDRSPLVIRLAQPLAKASFHCLRAIYPDGSVAIACARAWSDGLVYGMWGYINRGETAQERVDYYLNDLRRHHVNALMQSYGSEVAQFLSGDTGPDHSRATGIRAMRNAPGTFPNPLYYFLLDEPDAHDFAVSQLTPPQRLGALAQSLVRRSAEFRRQDPLTPQLLNIDNTFKPENYYTYAQLPDVYCSDPYFQEQQRIAWNDRPAWAASFIKPTYVLGAATICASACAPRPLHIILNAVRHDSPAGGFRFATPAEKTVELFYALAGGAKGLSYWWYTPYGEFHGCGADDKEAVALWNQIGRLGAQVRAAGPLITRSCPASVPVTAPAKLWTRTLLAGTDSLLLLVVNDNIASDRLGTVVVPLQKAEITLTLPAWLNPAEVFEVTPDGFKKVPWQKTGGKLRLDLDKIEVARLLVVTSD